MKKRSNKQVTLEEVSRLITKSHEDLARTVASGFSEQEKVFSAKIESEVQGVEQRLGAQIFGINNRFDALADQKVTWDAHTRLAARVTRLENSPHFRK